MKIIHTADWHIGKMLNDYSLIIDQKAYFDNFISDLKIIKPDALLVSGDIYDRSVPSAEAITLLNHILKEIVLGLKIPTFMISGNHDSKERLSFAGDLLEQSGLYIAGNITDEIKHFRLQINAQFLNIFMLPYIEPHNVKSLFPNAQIKTHNEAVNYYCKCTLPPLKSDEINIMMAHGMFQCFGENQDLQNDVSVGGSDMVNAHVFSEFDYVALGHLHSHKTAGNEKMIYAGSPLKYSVDEAGQNKSYTEFSFDEKKELSIKTHSIKPLHDVRILSGTLQELTNRSKLCLCDEKSLDDYVFAQITDDSITLNAIALLRSIYKNILGLEYVNLTSKNITGETMQKAKIKLKSEAELFFEFYKTALDESLEKDDMDYITALLDDLKKGQCNHDSD